MKSIFERNLADILPSSIRDDKNLNAAAQALDIELEKIASLAKLTLHLPRLDELPSDVLDHLAFQFHCDFWKDDLPIETKRKQIRESIFWHRIKGTPAGVEKGISAFVDNPRVEENWQYGGKPYFFKIVCAGFQNMKSDVEFMRLLYNVKNCRSWLEDLSFDLTLEEAEKYYHAIVEYHSADEENFYPVDLPPEKQIISPAIFETESGIETVEFTKNDFDFKQYYFAVAELEYGTETVSPESVDNKIWWDWYIWQKWLDWSVNPAASPYMHEDTILPPFTPEIIDLPPEIQKLAAAFAELEGGEEVTEFNAEDKVFRNYKFAVAELEYGTETVSPESVDDDLWWKWFVRKNWRDWSVNPVAQSYAHVDEIDDIPPFNPDDFPPDANLLQLYFGFPNNRYRYLTLQNPRENLSAADLNHVGKLSTNLLKSTAGLNSLGLVRAFFLSRKCFKVF